MTINGMRTDEIRAILDENYYKQAYESERKNIWYYENGTTLKYCGFLGDHVDTFVKALGNGGARVVRDGVEVPVYDGSLGYSPGGDRWGVYGLDNAGSRELYERAQQYVKEQITDADIIVVDNCMNNFGTYLAERIGGFAGMPGYEKNAKYHLQTLDDISGISDQTWAAIKVLKKELIDNTNMLDNETAEEFVNAFLYCYADCVTNFSANIETIRELNPNAKIIAVGVYNTLDGVTLKVNGQEIPFGELAAKGFSLVNAYIKGLDKNSPNYYLKRNFNREYSDLGVPYVQENCDLATSDNIIIYGHHIKGGKMFGSLDKFTSKSFYEKHKIIQFNTLSEQSQYQIIAVFKTVAYSASGFRYYDFVNGEDEADFNAYVSRCKELALYDTGVTAKYGDKLLTLSTCKRFAENGRLAVVAKKIG